MSQPEVKHTKQIQFPGIDVKSLERAVMAAEHCLRMQRLGAPEPIMRHLYNQVGTNRPEFYAEMDQVLHNTQEKYGYHINHISSGKTVYVVTSTREDKDGNYQMVDIGEFDTMKEAEECEDDSEECVGYTYSEIDKNEWWAIIGPDGENATRTMYPYRERAFVFLLGLLGNRVPEWRRYVNERYFRAAEASMKSDPNIVDDIVNNIKYGGADAVIGFTEMIRHAFHHPIDRELIEKAYAEVEYVYKHLEEFGYKLNTISSGKVKYCVTRNNEEELDNVIGTFPTEEEARQAAINGDEKIEAFDPDERYALVTLEGKNATGEIYDNEGAAIAYVLDKFPGKVPNWRKWYIQENSPETVAVKRRISQEMSEVISKIESEGK